MQSNEPVLDARDIQGNILPGFRRERQRLVAYRVRAAAAPLTAALAVIAPHLTDMSEMLEHKDVRKAAFLSGHAPPQGGGVFLNYALGVAAADALGLGRAGDVEEAFRAGMAARAGDTTERFLPDGRFDSTCPENWQVGGPNRTVDLLLIFAGDADLGEASDPILAAVAACGLDQVYDETGALLPQDKEHFGFQDGISQPGVLGVTNIDGVERFVTTRYGVPGELGYEFGKPGQPLMPAEQFLFEHDEPDLRNGSFLVFRRLTQDLLSFDADTARMATEVATALGQIADPEGFRACIVGRWPSGQPLMRPIADPEHPETAMALNHFQYAADVPGLMLSTGELVGAAAGDLQVQSGGRCPIWAHVRKVNPRDLQTNLGGPDDTKGRQMLRRGIPFGPPYHRDYPGHPDNNKERGLLFLSYQRSITDQFEALNGNWMNSDSGPMAGGFDLLVGQNLLDGRHGPKSATYFDPASLTTTPIATLSQWVKPTGGEYLFAPSVSWTNRMAAVTELPRGPETEVLPEQPGAGFENS